MLHRIAKVQRGQKILVHGAGGAVGTAMLELGRLLDLEMYGTASKSKHDLIIGLGGIPIDYKSTDFLERVQALDGDGLNAAFDAIGGENFKRSFKSLKSGGTLVAYGFYNQATGGGGSVPMAYMKIAGGISCPMAVRPLSIPSEICAKRTLNGSKKTWARSSVR